MPNEWSAVTHRERSNAEWLHDLRSEGRAHAVAVQELREYLLRAVLLYYRRNRSDLSHLRREELMQLAEDVTQDALLMILDKLDTFRGDSKFTTWAYRVAINQAASDLRRRRWRDVSLDAMNEAAGEELPSLLATLQDTSANDPHVQLARKQVWEAIQRVIDEEFTERQRVVFVSQYFHGIPPDLIAEQLGTNRNNVYKIAHDARIKLKKRLLAQGLTEGDVLAAFEND